MSDTNIKVIWIKCSNLQKENANRQCFGFDNHSTVMSNFAAKLISGHF